MLAIIGYIVVFGSILAGYMIHGGVISLLWQPSEVLIILGAALGAFVVSGTSYSLSQVCQNIPRLFIPRAPNKQHYLQTLGLLYALFSKMHREGVVSIEKDIEDPAASSIFAAFPKISADMQMCHFISDTLRTYLTTGKADELDDLMDTDLHSLQEELHVAPSNISHMADSLPGFGIVAAVLGVVLTMSKLDAGAKVLGESIGAALLGTFLGILLCYGFFGPIAAKLENLKQERSMYFHCVREAVMAALRGLSPMIALEYGRRSIPPKFRPTFAEMESSLKG
ncbi:MAG: flagellar motor stator protein MotA [Deltaproteobacteria bacterium]|jgi:chemotaxis protein MotA|nr:flagellar motor stator protein MotA [Deltaproteobacteria bacterium]